MGRILREVSAGGPKAVHEYSVWRAVPPLGTHYKSDHAHPAQAGRCHAGRLSRRYHSHPGPGYRRTKRSLLVCCRFALQLLHLCGSLRRHENRELIQAFKDRKEFAVIRLYYFKERADGTPLPEDAQEMTWEEVSFQIDKGLKTVIRWRNEIINDMAICLFGIDAAIQAGTDRKKKE